MGTLEIMHIHTMHRASRPRRNPPAGEAEIAEAEASAMLA